MERVLEDYHDCVIDFGAGHSVYENHEQFTRVQAALASYQNVVLILPSPNPEVSIRILIQRTADLIGAFGQGFNWHELFVRHPSDYTLAKNVLYTEGKTPQKP